MAEPSLPAEPVSRIRQSFVVAVLSGYCREYAIDFWKISMIFLPSSPDVSSTRIAKQERS